MELQKIYITHFRHGAKNYNAVVKVNAFFNGYRIAKVIVDNEQHWALYDGLNWKLMDDMRRNLALDQSILKYLKALLVKKDH